MIAVFVIVLNSYNIKVTTGPSLKIPASLLSHIASRSYVLLSVSFYILKNGCTSE